MNDPRPTAIIVENISKDFILPHEKIQSVKSAFLGILRNRHTKTKESQHALREITFEIKKGEFFGILGKNGSGKSTLLKILAGIYTPTNGRVETRGKIVPFIELGVGFNPELTGRENVYLNGAMLGFSKRQIDAHYDDIVAFAELERFMDQKLKNYSSGMQVRLAFSVAIKAEADILIVDEVLAVGDADFQRKCFRYFKELKKNKKTVVFVSHDMNAVREYCDRAILINNSVITMEGKAEQVSQGYLRLFNDASNDEGKWVEEENRWGNRWLYYSKVNYKLTNEELVIDLEVTANRDVDGAVYGFRVRNNVGDDITGTNSKIRGYSLPELKKGQKARLQWRLPNVFSNGTYYIDPAIELNNGTAVLDWWNEAKKFSVTKIDATTYPITPVMDLHFKVAGSSKGGVH